MSCPHCGSNHIETGVPIKTSGKGEWVGPQFGAIIGIACTAILVCDICLDCGEITRLYTNSYDHKHWVKKGF